MPNFSASSQKILDGCHPDLIKLFQMVVKSYDCTILCGRRSIEDQMAAYNRGDSKVKFGKHNKIPAEAVDVAPFPVDWRQRPKSLARFYHFAGYVQRCAEELNIKIRWGGDWDKDRIFDDQMFDDCDHFELIP